MWKKITPSRPGQTTKQHCQRCSFKYIGNDMMSYFYFSDIWLWVSHNAKEYAVCLHDQHYYEEFPTLFSILIAPDSHLSFSLPAASVWWSYLLACSFLFFSLSSYLATCLPVPSSLCLCFCQSPC